MRWLVCLSLLLNLATISARADDDIETAASLLEILLEVDQESARKTLVTVAEKVQSGELDAKHVSALELRLGKTLQQIHTKGDHALAFEAALLASAWQDTNALATLRQIAESKRETPERRAAAIAALVTTEQGPRIAAQVLSDAKSPLVLRTGVLSALGRSEAEEVAEVVLAGYAKYEAELQPKAIELLTQRVAWSKRLLDAIEKGRIPADVLNVNQLAKLQASSDAELKDRVKAKWGVIRAERNRHREQVVAEMRRFLNENLGDPHRGSIVFNRVCGQCHKIHGQGQEVGPDITLNGRASFDQLLSNVLDPSLVIGAAYQARQVATTDGRVLAGLLVEDSQQRVVLKLQGGKVETIPRYEVEEITTSSLSLMPEGLENQLKREEMADLFAFLALDRAPTDREARYIPGTPARK